MNHRILLVDDEIDILEFVRYNLVREGYEVTRRRTGPKRSKRPPAAVHTSSCST